MDPNYSVLLGEGDAEDPCAAIKNNEEKNSVKPIVYAAAFIAIAGTLPYPLLPFSLPNSYITSSGLAILVIATYFVIYPRLKLYIQLRRSNRYSLSNSTSNSAVPLQSIRNSSGRGLPKSEEEFVVEKRPDLEVTTSAGRFVVQM